MIIVLVNMGLNVNYAWYFLAHGAFLPMYFYDGWKINWLLVIYFFFVSQSLSFRIVFACFYFFVFYFVTGNHVSLEN